MTFASDIVWLRDERLPWRSRFRNAWLSLRGYRPEPKHQATFELAS